MGMSLMGIVLLRLPGLEIPVFQQVVQINLETVGFVIFNIRPSVQSAPVLDKIVTVLYGPIMRTVSLQIQFAGQLMFMGLMSSAKESITPMDSFNMYCLNKEEENHRIDGAG